MKNSMSLRTSLHVLSAALILGLIATTLGFQFTGRSTSPKDALKQIVLPQGRQVYSVAQAAEVWPKILETHIDPPDVHVGWTQTLEVIVQSPQPVKSVIAKIGHDAGTDEVRLDLVEQVSKLEVEPAFQVASNGKVVLPSNAGVALVEKAHAQQEYPKYLYRGKWVVHDTHDTFYRTTFIATDDAGATNQVDMAWSDACGIPKSGDFTLSSPCTISGADGVEAGNLVVNSSLTLNADFGYNSGKGITIGTGSIIICNGCRLLETNLWYTDVDGDGYPGGTAVTLSVSNPGGKVRRYAANASTDCYDSNSDAFPGQTAFFTGDRGDGSFDYDCSGATTPDPQDDTGFCNGGDERSCAVDQLGFNGSSPGCGAGGDYIYTCTWNSKGGEKGEGGCDPDLTPTTLSCR